MADERIVAFDDDEVHDADDGEAGVVKQKSHTVALVAWTLVLVFVVPYLLKHVPAWVEWVRHRMHLQRASQTALEIVKLKLEAAEREAETHPASPTDSPETTQQRAKATTTKEEENARGSFSLEASVLRSRQQAAAGTSSHASTAAEKRSKSEEQLQGAQWKRTTIEQSREPNAQLAATRKMPQRSQSTAAPRSAARIVAQASNLTPISRPPIEDDFERVRREQDVEFERSVQEDLAKRQVEAARQAELEKLAATKAAMRETLVQEPEEDDENAITLGVRIGTDPKQRFVRRFLKHHTLGDIANFVYSHPLLDGVPFEQVKICFGYQSKPVEPSAFLQSLEQFGIASHSVVVAWVDRSLSSS